MIEAETNEDADAWVAALADPARRDAAFEELVALGPSARDAVIAGLGDGRWAVRRLCVLWLWRTDDEARLSLLLPLLHDARSQVRHAAVVAISGASSPADSKTPVAVSALLVERALTDESPRVRRQAVSMLAWQHAHPDLEGFFAGLIECEDDAALLRFAGQGLLRCRGTAP